MKKIILCIACVFCSIFLAACYKISSPEDMLAAPELNKEKKEMKEAVEKFKQPDTTTYPVYFSESKKSVNMITNDLDSDSNSEIISFYKNKINDKIGMFILKKENSMWIKMSNITFDSYEMSNVIVTDLSGDGKKEILIESYDTGNNANTKKFSIVYMEDSAIKYIKEVPYIVMKVADINEDGKKEIFYISKESQYSPYRLNMDYFDSKSIVNKKKIDLGKIENPYDMMIGKIHDDVMAIFINYMNENRYENTKILMYDYKGADFVSVQERMKEKYVFNVETKDIDGDGIIEVGYEFKAPNYKVPYKEIDDRSVVKGYFKIKSDYTLELVKEVYDSVEYGYVINFPTSFKGKYTLLASDDSKTVSVNYINNQGKEYELMKLAYIEKYKWQKDAKMRDDMQLITEGQDYVVAGQVLDNSESLKAQEKEEYLKMRSEILILSNIVKERII